MMSCRETRLEGGEYRAHAMLCRADQPGDTVVAATPAELVFISEEAAVAHARAWAAHWVDENLGA
jgi:hypothetical protein